MACNVIAAILVVLGMGPIRINNDEGQPLIDK